MFYSITFGNPDSKLVKQLQHNLCGIPNGYITSDYIHIKSLLLPKNKWVYWFPNKMGQLTYDCLSTTPGIENIKLLDNILITPSDKMWVWDDNFIYKLFNEII